ncbi:MAG TPA: beta-propeller domain-containing protein, partial [Chthoniobacteraceae bacterium]
RGGSVTVAGEALDKFKMHEANRILTVVSQKSRPRTQAEINELLRTLPPDPRRPVWITTSPVNSTEVNTFSLAVPAAPVALGRLELAPDETLHGTRFDGSRLYIITAKHKPWIHVSYVIDPLWIVDLTNPATPTVLGELEMPGYSTYIEPLGDRLVTIGLLDQRPTVSLFDISDPTKPAELSRVQLDAGWSEAVWNEKAFSVLPEENLILLPVSGSNQLTGASAAGVQLLDLHRDFIVKRGILQRSFAPRRATLHRERILAISPESLIAADATDRDNPKVTADMEIAWNVDRVFLLGDQLVQLASEWTADGTHRVTATTAPVGSPDDASEVLEIPGGMLADAVVRDGVLYLVQVQAARTTWDYELYTHRQVSPGLVTLSSIEVSKLPQLSVLSSVASAHPSANMWSQYSAKALWLGETSLAVTIPDVQPARLIPYWYDPAPYEAGNRLFAYLGMASTGAVASPRVTLPKGRGVRVKGRVIDPAGSWLLGDRNPTTQHILAFDVSTPSRLLLASRISIGKDQPWDVSAPIAAEGRLYAGFRHLGAAISGEEFYKADRSNPDAFKKPDGESLENRHFVQAVDYSDLENPIAAAKQPNIPGRLVSTTFSGDLLLTVGQHYNPETGAPSPNTAALHASALRGESAHLLDQLPLRTQNDPLRFRGSVIFHFDGQPLTSWLRPSLQSRVGKSTLSTWKLGEVGKFEALDTLELGQESMFSIYNELGVAMATPNEPHLLDLSDPTNLVSLGTRKLEGAPHMNYEAADGAVGRGLWIPTGSFGLESLSLGE